jgi:PAS domain-containing protein
VRALLVDVAPGHARRIVGALEDAGWRVRWEAVEGADGLTAALHRRGWGVVLYGGDGDGAVPARKALALVRLADPHLPFLAVSPLVQNGDLAAMVRGLDGAAALVPDPARLPAALARTLDKTRLRRRVGGAHKLLLAQQAITGDIAAGLDPDELALRVLSTLGETLGWNYGAVWRPRADGTVLECACTWHVQSGGAELAALARDARSATFAPGQGLPGRVWAFRRPAWVADVHRDGNEPRADRAVRAGLLTAVAFPIAAGDECAGVIEFFAGGMQRPNAELNAMFTVVGSQLAQYLSSRRAADPARALLDAAGTPIVALDAAGRVLLANRAACAAAGRELAGADWFEAVAGRAARTAFAELLATGRPARLELGLGAVWSAVPLQDGAGALATAVTAAAAAA